MPATSRAAPLTVRRRATTPGVPPDSDEHRVETLAELDAVHRRVLDLGGTLRLDRSDDPEERLRVHAGRDGHTFCVFVA